MSAERHSEETKMMVPRGAVTVSKDGHVTIHDPRLVEKLKAMEEHATRGTEAATGVGVVVSESF